LDDNVFMSGTFSVGGWVVTTLSNGTVAYVSSGVSTVYVTHNAVASTYTLEYRDPTRFQSNRPPDLPTCKCARSDGWENDLTLDRPSVLNEHQWQLFKATGSLRVNSKFTDELQLQVLKGEPWIRLISRDVADRYEGHYRTLYVWKDEWVSRLYSEYELASVIFEALEDEVTLMTGDIRTTGWSTSEIDGYMPLMRSLLLAQETLPASVSQKLFDDLQREDRHTFEIVIPSTIWPDIEYAIGGDVLQHAFSVRVRERGIIGFLCIQPEDCYLPPIDMVVLHYVSLATDELRHVSTGVFSTHHRYPLAEHYWNSLLNGNLNAPFLLIDRKDYYEE